MSVLARRRREEDDARYRALLEMRDSVIAAVTWETPYAGSLAIEEAVDKALVQVLKKGAHRCEPALARNWWISWAEARLIDYGRRGASKYRDRIPVDEHPQALARGAEDEALELLDNDELTTAGLHEVLGMLKGLQREWAHALFAQLLCAAEGEGEALPALAEMLGWSAAKTQKTGERARVTMTAFITDRATGKICSRRQAVLDAYITVTEGRAGAAPGDADRREFEAVVLHLACCPECQVAWRRRRSSLLARLGAVVMVPLDSLAAAAHTAAGKLTGMASSAQNVTIALLQRVGIGRGVGVGGALGIGTKTAAVCVGVVCAAGTATGELTGVLPPLLPDRTPELRHHAITPARVQPASSTAGSTPAINPRQAPSAPRTPRSAGKLPASSSATQTPSSTHARRTAVAPPPPPPPPPPPASRPGFTPGDLLPASATRTANPPPPPPPPPPPRQPTCTPGDLGC
jgi:hypothetical protein